ncbi:MAG: HAD family hydrolase, partial [Bacteroidota bacterium]
MQGRDTMIRLKKKDNIEFKELNLPKGLKTTFSQGDLEIIPSNSGKGNAIKYLAKKLGLKNTIGIGNDINDIEMLKVTGKKYVVRNNNQKIMDIAQTEGWYISTESNMAGINEILKEIKNIDLKKPLI